MLWAWEANVKNTSPLAPGSSGPHRNCGKPIDLLLSFSLMPPRGSYCPFARFPIQFVTTHHHSVTADGPSLNAALVWYSLAWHSVDILSANSIRPNSSHIFPLVSLAAHVRRPAPAAVVERFGALGWIVGLLHH